MAWQAAAGPRRHGGDSEVKPEGPGPRPGQLVIESPQPLTRSESGRTEPSGTEPSGPYPPAKRDGRPANDSDFKLVGGTPPGRAWHACPGSQAGVRWFKPPAAEWFKPPAAAAGALRMRPGPGPGRARCVCVFGITRL